MHLFARRLVSSIVSFAIAFGPVADAAAAAGADSYFRYRIDGVDAQGIHVMLRGPETPVVSGSPISVRTRVIGGSAPYAFALETGALPPGLAVAAASGDIDGVATEAGNYDFTVRATDVNGSTAVSQPFRVVVQYRKLEIVRTPSLSARKDQTYSDRLAAAGGKEPYAWSVAEGALPAGVMLDQATGVIAGTPTSLGQFPFRARVADAAGGNAVTGQLVLFVDAAALSIAGSSPTNGNVGSTYTGRFEATGGAPPYSYVLPAGALPPGVSLDGGTGWVRGVPSAPGLYPNIKVRAVDSTRRYADSAPFSVNVFADLAAAWDGQSAVRDVAYSGSVKAYGGRAPYSFLLTAGELPVGLTLDAANGVVSGTPTRGAEATGLDVRVTDASGKSVQTGPFSISVSNKLTIVSAPSRGAVRGQNYSSGFATGGGTRPYGYRLVRGALPTGLSLGGSTGVISGAPSSNGTASGLQVQVTDAVGDDALSPLFDIDVLDAIRASVASVPSYGTVGTAYSGAPTVSGGRSPYMISLGGSLPSGLSFDPSSGAITGTPSAAGTSAGLALTIVDRDGRSGVSQPFGIRISNPLTVGAPLLRGMVGESYASAASVTGGASPFVVQAPKGLPAGLSLDETNGRISGRPTQAGTIAGFQIRVNDADGRVATTAVQDFVIASTLKLTAPAPAFGTVGQAYAGTVSISGGTAPYSLRLASGSLPVGLSLDPATGAIAGTPTMTSAGAFVLVAADAAGRTVQINAAIPVSEVVAFAEAPAPSASVGVDYLSQASTTGGRRPFSWSVSSGQLPDGLELGSASGSISGAPTGEGAFVFGLTVVDADGRTATSPTYPVDVRRPLSVLGAPAETASSGVRYEAQLRSDGGAAPYSWTLLNGRLPGGVSLDGQGLLSGTPTQGGSYSYSVAVTDAAGRRAVSRTFVLTVSSEFTIAADGLPTDLTTGEPVSKTFQVVGGDAPVVFASSGALPAGLSFDPASGILAGTPSAAGAYSIAVTARDGAGRTSSTGTFTIDVRSPLAIAGDPASGATFSRAYAARFPVAGGRGPYTYTSVGNGLPPGLTLSSGIDTVTKAPFGSLSGVPTAPGNFAGLVVRAIDAAGRAATSQTFTIEVIDRFTVSASLPALATVGQDFVGRIYATDGASPYRYAVSEGALPQGLQFDAATGDITGRPSAAGTQSGLIFTVTDARGRTASTDPIVIDVRSPISWSAAAPGFSIVGEPLFAKGTITGGRSPYTLSIAQGFLPAGISFDGITGDLSGTPTRSGSYNAQIVIRDADGRASPQTSVSLPVAGLIAIDTSAGQSRIPQAWTRGKAFVGSFVATGGHLPYKWTLVQGALPRGLSVDIGSGAITGTPEQVESRSGLVVQVADADGRTSLSAPFSIAVSDNPSFASLPGGYPTVGTAFSADPAVLGGTAPYSFALANGSVLPGGLVLDATTGTVSGTPTAAGVANLVMTVSDSLGATGQGAFTLDVRNPLAATGSFTGAATIEQYYASTVGITGGRAPLSIRIDSGSLPSGLELSAGSSSITLSGTPAATGISTFSIALADIDGRSAQAGPFTVDVRGPVSVVGSLPAVTVGHSYGASFTASGGRPGSYAFRVAGGQLPAGVSLEAATGIVSGTPTTAGTIAGIKIQALDPDQRVGETALLTFVVRPRIAATPTPPAPVATIGEAYSFSQAFTGGNRPYGYSIASGALPQGLSLDLSTGTVSGSPTAAGNSQGLSIAAVDADGDAATGGTFAIDVRTPVVVQAPSEILVETQTDGTWGSVSASGGAGSFVFALSSGKLPNGLVLDAVSGVVSGRTEIPADTNVRVAATDAQGRIGRSGDIRIKADPAVTVATSQPAQAQVGKSYSAYPMTASGGTPPYAYDMPKGALPAGLALDGASGRISGTPTLSGSYSFDLRVRDVDGRSATRAFTLPAVDPLAVSYPLGGRGAFVVAKASTYVPTATGGCLPLSSSIYAGGGLPAGIVEKDVGGFAYDGSAGLQTGSFNYIVRIQDACSNVVDSPVTLNVASSSPQVAVPARTTLVRSVATSLPQAAVSGGSAPFSYELAGTVPAGVTIDADTGVISGMVANAAGTSLGPVSVTVFDAYGRQAASPSFTLRVVDPVAITYSSTSLPFAVGIGSNYAPVLSGGCGSPVYSLSGSAPSTLGFSAATGAFSNGGFTSADVGTFGPVSVKVVDACSIQANISLSFDVRNGAPSASGTATSYFVVGQSGTTGPVQAVNMAAPTFAIASGTLPTGLSFDASTGTISGTFPASTPAGSSYVFTVTTSDAYGRTASTGNVRINAVTQPAVAYQNGGRIGLVTNSAQSTAPTVTGGCSVSSYALKSGSLPTGMSLNAASGAIAGTPSATGQFGPATVELTDTCTQKATASVSFDVQSVVASAVAPSQRILVVGKQSTTDAATWAGFSADAVATILGGNLPTGISFAGNKLSGTLPASTAAGASFGSYQIRVADSWGRTAQSSAFSLTAASPPAIVYANASSATIGQAFTLQPNVGGGAAPYTYVLTGALPAGLSFSTSNGGVTGTPTASMAATNYTVTATDAAGVDAVSNTFTITTTGGVVVAGTPGTASQGQAYTYTFTATGGQAPYAFSTTGTLPPGLSISTAGVLSGTATASATYSFTVVATDAGARAGSLATSVTVKTASNIGNWYAWGAGELGRGSNNDRSNVPVSTTVLPRMSQVAAWRNTGCGIADGGGAVCWGIGTSGQLGNGATVSSEMPVTVSGNLTWTQLTAAQQNFCGITAGSDLYCWGAGTGGKLGNGDSNNRSSPTAVNFGAKWIAVSAGVLATCGIRDNGGLYCWGADTALNINSALPTQVGTSTWSQIVVNNGNACGVRSDGALMCWGTGYYGATGQGGQAADTKVPTQVGSAKNWVSSYMTQSNGCAINTLGEIHCWGTNGGGSLGRGSSDSSLVALPGKVSGTYTFAKMRGGYFGNYCGITTDSQLLCWGNNANGYLGDGTTSNRFVPTPPVGAQQAFSDVYLGYDGTYGLPNGGTSASPTGKVYGWGTYTALANGGTGAGNTPMVGVGGGLQYRTLSNTYVHSCGVKTDNTGVCWGQNSSGQLGNGDTGGTTAPSPVSISGNRKWIDVKAGYLTTCGISDAGALFCWGAGIYGSAGTGTDQRSAQTTPAQIAPSGYSRLAMGTQYTHCAFQGSNLWCWGSNTNGQVGSGSSSNILGPTQVSGAWAQAAAADSFTCAIKTDGTLWCWGDNSFRQYGSTAAASKVPVAVQPASTWLQLAASNGGICAIRSDSRLFCWGNNQDVGSLVGDRNAATPLAKGANATPTEVFGGGVWSAISGSSGYSQTFCGTKQDGSIACWGSSSLVPGSTQTPAPVTTIATPQNLYGVSVGWSAATAFQ